MVVGRVRRHTIGLSVHATLAIRSKSSLTVSRVVLVVVRVAVVWVVVSGVLSSGSLRLRAGTSLLLRLLLLSLSDGVGGRVAAVLVLVAAAESWLVVARAALRVLAKVIGLGGIVTSKGSLLLRGNALGLGMCSLLAIVLAVKGIWVSVLLVSSVVGGVVARGRAESCTRLLCGRLGGLSRKIVKGWLRGGSLLVERIQRLLLSRGDVLRASLAKSTVLLDVRDRRLSCKVIISHLSSFRLGFAKTTHSERG